MGDPPPQLVGADEREQEIVERVLGGHGNLVGAGRADRGDASARDRLLKPPSPTSTASPAAPTAKLLRAALLADERGRGSLADNSAPGASNVPGNRSNGQKLADGWSDCPQRRVCSTTCRTRSRWTCSPALPPRDIFMAGTNGGPAGPVRPERSRHHVRSRDAGGGPSASRSARLSFWASATRTSGAPQ